MAIISKEEFLKACESKMAQDKALADERRRQEEARRKAEEERRRREEEERRRIGEEERRRREEEERRRQEEARRKAEEERIRKENAEWDRWYNTLPSGCKNGFVFNNFQYSINKSTRTITKVLLLGDPRNVMLGDPRDRINPRDVMDLRKRDDVRGSVAFSGNSDINSELGI